MRLRGSILFTIALHDSHSTCLVVLKQIKILVAIVVLQIKLADRAFFSSRNATSLSFNLINSFLSAATLSMYWLRSSCRICLAF